MDVNGDLDSCVNKVEFKCKFIPQFECIPQWGQLIPKVRRREIEHLARRYADRLKFGSVLGSNSGDEP